MAPDQHNLKESEEFDGEETPLKRPRVGFYRGFILNAHVRRSKDSPGAPKRPQESVGASEMIYKQSGGDSSLLADGKGGVHDGVDAVQAHRQVEGVGGTAAMGSHEASEDGDDVVHRVDEIEEEEEEEKEDDSGEDDLDLDDLGSDHYSQEDDECGSDNDDEYESDYDPEDGTAEDDDLEGGDTTSSSAIGQVDPKHVTAFEELYRWTRPKYKLAAMKQQSWYAKSLASAQAATDFFEYNINAEAGPGLRKKRMGGSLSDVFTAKFKITSQEDGTIRCIWGFRIVLGAMFQLNPGLLRLIKVHRRRDNPDRESHLNIDWANRISLGHARFSSSPGVYMLRLDEGKGHAIFGMTVSLGFRGRLNHRQYHSPSWGFSHMMDADDQRVGRRDYIMFDLSYLPTDLEYYASVYAYAFETSMIGLFDTTNHAIGMNTNMWDSRDARFSWPGSLLSQIWIRVKEAAEDGFRVPDSDRNIDRDVTRNNRVIRSTGRFDKWRAQHLAEIVPSHVRNQRLEQLLRDIYHQVTMTDFPGFPKCQPFERQPFKRNLDAPYSVKVAWKSAAFGYKPRKSQ